MLHRRPHRNFWRLERPHREQFWVLNPEFLRINGCGLMLDELDCNRPGWRIPPHNALTFLSLPTCFVCLTSQ